MPTVITVTKRVSILTEYDKISSIVKENDDPNDTLPVIT